MKRIIYFILLAFCAYSFFGLSTSVHADTAISGKIIIFHAGSLTVPLQKVAQEFKKVHPKIEFQMEAAGSVESARKVSDLNKAADIVASADYLVIDQLLVPQFADWNIKFATNEMAIVYHDKSRRSAEINSNNWYEILLDKKIVFARSEPNSDPCGYRSLFTMQLAEKFYNKPGLFEQMVKKDTNYIRPKETDLLALLESGSIDYIFLYRSVATQHGLKYVVLPNEINLKDPKFAELYSMATTQISGKKPGETITQRGTPMVYGITIPKNSPNPQAAKEFVKYLLTKDLGLKIIENAGQPSAVPSPCNGFEKLPADLKTFALK